MSIDLRPYQDKALSELLGWFGAGHDGNPIIDACVGSGKSVMIGWLCQHAITEYPETRIIMLVPTKELLEQNLEKLLELWPDAPVGIVSASVGKKQLGKQITIATIGSLYKHADRVGHIDLIIVDECHAIPGGDVGMYRKFFAELQRFCPDVRIIGATGTPFRGNGEWLTTVENPLFSAIVARVTMDNLLEQGYLSPLTTSPTTTKLDADGVKVIGGDYVVSELAKAVDRPELVDAACDEAVRLAQDRKKWLVYCVTVEHAGHVKDALAARGITAQVITGETPKAERAGLIAAFRRGEIRALVSVAVLTTGFNVEDVDCIILLRNTKSPVLYVQIMGRGMRIADGKADCLVLDFTDTIERLGPVNKVKGRKRKPGKGEAPVKVCDECGSLNPIHVTECTTCGHPFEVEEQAPHRTSASDAPVMLRRNEKIIKTYEVSKVTYSIHKKAGKPDSVKVTYWQGISPVANEWVCFEHGGFAQSKAESWWRSRSPLPVPQTSGGAILTATSSQLKAPRFIKVDETAKYPEITGFYLNDPRTKEAA